MKTCLLHLGLWQAVPLGPDSKEHLIYSSNEGLSPPPGTPTGCSAGTWQQGTSHLFIKWRPVSSTWDSDRLFRWDLTTRNIPFIHQMKTCLLHLGLWQAVPLGPDNKEHPIYSSNEGLSPPPGTLTGCSVGTWQQGTYYTLMKTCLLQLGLWQAVPLGPDIKEHPIYSSNQDLYPPPGTLKGCSAGTWQQGTSHLIQQMKTCLLHLGLWQVVPLGPDSKEHIIYSSLMKTCLLQLGLGKTVPPRTVIKGAMLFRPGPMCPWRKILGFSVPWKSLRTLKITPRNLNEILRSWLRVAWNWPADQLIDWLGVDDRPSGQEKGSLHQPWR